MTEQEQRAAVVTEALTWLGTPYHNHARIKGVGVDCANLPAAVYHAAGLIPDLKPEYAAQWYMHRDEELYLDWVKPYAREIQAAEAGPGDFVIWKFGRTFSHGAIILAPPQIIHASLAGGCAHLADMERDDDLAVRPRRFFTLWGTA